MSNEMIDRVASELCQRFKDKVSAHAGMTFEETGGVAVPNAEIWIDYARTAIRAIRKPTQEMMTAAIDVGGELGWGCYYINYENVWQAIIDKMLE